jgi:hypothetical protein
MARKYREDLSERQIRFDLLHGMSLEEAAKKHGCSIALICKIRDGKRLSYTVPPDKLCVCCELRPKAKNNRFLCEVCYKGISEEGPGDTEYTHCYKLPECGWDDLA